MILDSNKLLLTILTLITALCLSCEDKEYTSEAVLLGDTFETEVVTHPSWSAKSSIISLETSSTSSISELEDVLPNVHKMGFDVVSISHILDVVDVEPDETVSHSIYSARPKILHHGRVESSIGDMNTMRLFVREAHSMGMKVIMEWYVGGTSNQHSWIHEHPSYYENSSSESAYKRLNFNNDTLSLEMIKLMENWIDSVSIDGFRVMDADFAPTHFWAQARKSLSSKKDILMICNSDNPNLHFDSFDATEIKNFPDLWDVFEGKESLEVFADYYYASSKRYIKNDYRMHKLTLDYDSSMSGPGMVSYDDFLRIKSLLSFTMPGLPLVNSGLALDSLSLDYESIPDSLQSVTYDLTDLTSTLVKLKASNPALSNGMLTGNFEVISEENSLLYAYSRTKDENKVLTVINFSLVPAEVVFENEVEEKMYGVFYGKELEGYTIGNRKIAPFTFEVFVNSRP